MAHNSPPRRAPRSPLLAVLIACVVTAGLFAVGVAADRYGSGRKTAVSAAAEPPAAIAPATPPPPGIGDAVRDGKFEFVVSRMDCSRTSIGIEHLKLTAKGKYCTVSLTVRNIAGESRYFLGQSQKAFDAAGVAYGSDEIAGIYLNRDTQTLLQKLDPGVRVSGKLVFDVPKKVKLSVLELHDSPLSGGVEVKLR